MNPMGMLAALTLATSLATVPSSFAQDKGMKPRMMDKKADMMEIMKACDMNHDGLVSKAEMIQHMEKMFDKYDKKKQQALDRKQFEEFWKELSGSFGG